MSNNSKVIREIQLQQTPYPGYHNDMETRFAPIGSGVDTRSYELAARSEKSIEARWNWGAFFFGWLWAICNGIVWPLVAQIVIIVCVFLLGLAGINPMLVNVIAALATWGIGIYLGAFGNELSLERKKWKSVDDFKHVQRIWAIIGWVVCGVSLGLYVALLIFAA